jgi:hypothetical protein
MFSKDEVKELILESRAANRLVLMGCQPTFRKYFLNDD